jgi:transcriptional regulator with XRE-family HTH domain
MTTRLQKLMKVRGISAATLARASGISPSTLNKLIHGHRKMAPHWAERLAPFFDLAVEEFFRPAEEGTWIPQYPVRYAEKVASRQDAAKLAALDERRVFGGIDIPIYRASKKSGLFFQISFEDIINRVRRPPGIEYAKNVFGFYVVTENMSERFIPGDVILVDQDRPPAVGDDVVVCREAGPNQVEARLGRLSIDMPSKRKIALHFGEEPWIDEPIDADEELKAYKILSTADLLGM